MYCLRDPAKISVSTVGDLMKLSIVSAYYENPKMLEVRLKQFQELPEFVEFIIVDDGSRDAPLENGEFPVRVKVFRVDKDIPWNQDAARNIGAHEAEGEWLLLTDMDHVVPAETVRDFLDSADPRKIYRFRRVTPNGDPVRPHYNTFGMTKEMYWRIGGYDEDFRGTYGTDKLFVRRLLAETPVEIIETPIVVYDFEAIPDAATRRYERNLGVRRRLRWASVKLQKALGLRAKHATFKEPYRRIV